MTLKKFTVLEMVSSRGGSGVYYFRSQFKDLSFFDKSDKPIVVMNGSHEGIGDFCRLFPNHYIVIGTYDETLEDLKDIPHTKSYYLYDSKNTSGDIIYDVGFPIMRLYDDFIDIQNFQ